MSVEATQETPVMAPPEIDYGPSCTMCGASGPCAYDPEDRPLIHAYSEAEVDSW